MPMTRSKSKGQKVTEADEVDEEIPPDEIVEKLKENFLSSLTEIKCTSEIFYIPAILTINSETVKTKVCLKGHIVHNHKHYQKIIKIQKIKDINDKDTSDSEIEQVMCTQNNITSSYTRKTLYVNEDSDIERSPIFKRKRTTDNPSPPYIEENYEGDTSDDSIANEHLSRCGYSCPHFLSIFLHYVLEFVSRRGSHFLP